MTNRMTLVFEYLDRPVHGGWDLLSAEVNGDRVHIASDALGYALGFEVHSVQGENVVTFDPEQVA